MWRSGSLPAMFKLKMTRLCLGAAEAPFQAPSAVQEFQDRPRQDVEFLVLSLAGWQRPTEPIRPDVLGKMMRFGLRGKTERQRGEAVQAIRANLGVRSIVLVGMPGSGKSAVGRRLATQLELAFVDADEEIELAAGKPIRDIFKDHGEAYFRDGERKVIARLLGAGPQVLATGGGAFMIAETRENIRRSGISVWLKAELTLLLRRVSKRNTRPLLEHDPEGAMRTLMETRYPIYQTADIAVESRDLPHEAIVGEIIDALAASAHLTGHNAEAQSSSVSADEAS
jgi:shikimate kinase